MEKEATKVTIHVPPTDTIMLARMARVIFKADSHTGGMILWVVVVLGSRGVRRTVQIGRAGIAKER